MKKINSLLIATLFALAGCGDSKPPTEDLITVDVTANYPKKELVLQDFMDVEYIPLETTDEFVCQGIVRAVSNNLLIITNKKNDGDIFIYDRNGKALRIINRRGQGGEEYNSISSITLDENRNELFVCDSYSHTILIYDLEGNFKRRLATDKNKIFYNVYDFDQEHLIVHDSFNENTTADLYTGQSFMLISKQEGYITKEIQIPFKEKKSVVTRFTDESGMTYVFQPNTFYPIVPYLDDYVLLEASADTLYKYSSLSTMKPFIVRTPSIQSMNPEGFLFPLMLTERYCFLAIFIKGSGYQDVMYDKYENTCFQYQVYNKDYTKNEEVSFKSKPLNREIPSCQSLDASKLVNDYQKGWLKGRLKEIASTMKEDDNPVIMLIKYKQK
ncbi:6-bladed beta-propeller [Parabacteroides acidifaciens]|uniref:6-bladed beta-propeller n=1 Tax=Parabacteroides acidifaciens TaxID=2290935 RepID=A0A3D8HF25_9BACT|nr:6-bladed beta-propeller [Parabacteroides acidifaciens]MBC8601742.1 6-bladed beta-propeller [Parabacteroides acidifaciens]RDU49575.1 6-bladed beta-propeller [Parabacteroides acidifaciens]